MEDQVNSAMLNTTPTSSTIGPWCCGYFTTVATTIQATITTTTSTATTAASSAAVPDGVQTFKDVLLANIGKEELHFLGWAGLAILLVLIIGCCIGCKGCCCRACCGSRETRFSSISSGKVPAVGVKLKEDSGMGQELAVGPVRRCCFHPRHCSFDIERPYPCRCQKVCYPCNRYVEKEEDEDSEESHNEFSRHVRYGGRPRHIANPPAQHRVEVDSAYVDDECSRPTNKKTRTLKNIPANSVEAPTQPYKRIRTYGIPAAEPLATSQTLVHLPSHKKPQGTVPQSTSKQAQTHCTSDVGNWNQQKSQPEQPNNKQKDENEEW